MSDLKLPDPAEQAKMSLLARLTSRSVRTETVVLANDPDQAYELAGLRNVAQLASEDLERLRRVWSEPSAKGDKILADAVAAEAAADDAVNAMVESIAADSWTFSFGSIGSAARSAIEALHPPTADQLKAAKEAQAEAARLRQQIPALPGFDVESMAIPLISAAMTSVSFGGESFPGLTESELTAMFETAGWTSVDLAMLFSAANIVDVLGSGVDLERIAKK